VELAKDAGDTAEAFVRNRLITFSESVGQSLSGMVQAQGATAALKSERMVAIYDPKNRTLSKLYRSEKDRPPNAPWLGVQL